LISGLEAVQGPNWAAILQLYGPGGSVSEALKDRSQVQLKDKARNLKLWFLKHGQGVPHILEQVTGHLKGERSSADDTPRRRGKKRRTEANEQDLGTTSQPTQAYPEGTWSQTGQGQREDVDMVGQNVDPGLQMPQGN
jgi:hypothetical protein